MPSDLPLAMPTLVLDVESLAHSAKHRQPHRVNWAGLSKSLQPPVLRYGITWIYIYTDMHYIDICMLKHIHKEVNI